MMSRWVISKKGVLETLPEEVAIDTLTVDQRSRLMSRIQSRDTTPELVVRSMLHRMGYRFRLHRKELPGKPDVVLPRHREVVLVHGCFWHGHGCKLGPVPKSNQGYWSFKIAGSRARLLHSAGRFWSYGNARFVIYKEPSNASKSSCWPRLG